jgi:hypothetical protein
MRCVVHHKKERRTESFGIGMRKLNLYLGAIRRGQADIGVCRGEIEHVVRDSGWTLVQLQKSGDCDVRYWPIADIPS